MDALKTKEVREETSPKKVNELLLKGWYVLKVFLRNKEFGNEVIGQIVYVLGKDQPDHENRDFFLDLSTGKFVYE